MIDRRYAIIYSIVYAAVLGILALTGTWGAFLVVAVIGGPGMSLMYWLAAKRPQRQG
jgi:hypothetical protein